MRLLCVLVLLCAAVPAAPALAQADVMAGQRSYDTVCAGCHGFDGQGNRLVAAPRLAGIESSYLEEQLRKFSTGIRGHVDGDINGQRMALMASAVTGPRALGDLVAYIASLPAQTPAATIEGDAARGQAAYALCAACHGVDGGGNSALRAPSLVALDDWYVVEQLRLFAEGLRGTNPEDTTGAQMRALATSFDDDAKRRDLAAHIRSLSL
jgi:cytochrome c553